MPSRDKLGQIKDITITLDTSEPITLRHYARPALRLRASLNSQHEPRITVEVGPLWGQSPREVDLTPGEAIQLAISLHAMAQAIEAALKEDTGNEN